MKRLIYISILLFLTSNLVSQDIVTIEGIAYAVPSFRQKDTIPVEKVEIRLRLKDTSLKQLTSTDGKFLFKIKRSALTATLDVSTSKQTTSREKYLCVFWGGDANTIDIEKASIIIWKNIQVRANELMHCVPEIAELFFPQNSATPNVAIAYDTIAVDIAIKNLSSLLLDFPNMQLEINGHSDSKESDKVNLANNRATYVADKLISMGVKKSQLVIKSYGDKRPFPNTDNYFANQGPFPFTKDKKILSQRNQRIAFKILTFGFEDNGAND
jgi:hypothetical protein